MVVESHIDSVSAQNDRVQPGAAAAPVIVGAASSADETDDREQDDAQCRICFELSDAGGLIEPCGCRGTQSFVHNDCLLRWRRLQVVEGKLVAATRCEVCGVKYAASLARPTRPLSSVVREYFKCLLEATVGVLLCIFTLRSPVALFVFVASAYWCGVARVTLFTVVAFPLFLLLLYRKGFKISLIGTSGETMQLGLTSFGEPVEGLCPGMLLVSIGAGEPFAKTVLYVMEHSDSGSLALILNKEIPNSTVARDIQGLEMSLRFGGPCLPSVVWGIHNIPRVPGAERLLRNEQIFLSRDISMDHVTGVCSTHPHHLVLFKGLASWGPQQLQGEVRRGAWGWINPEHVHASDVLELNRAKLAQTWVRLMVSPNLNVFEG